MITKRATTTHGGIVSEVLETFTIDGKKIHLDGMQHYCPTCKKTVSAIGSDSTKTVMGKKMVAEGDKTTCGASFIANQGLAFIGGESASGQSNTSSGIADILAGVVSVLSKYAAQLKCVDKSTNEVLSNRKYYIERANGEKIYGMTDNDGLTEMIKTDTAEEVSIHFYFVSPSGELIADEDITK